MARQWALQAARKLRARLDATHDADAEGLQKSLKMLSDLPIAADILEETGVRRSVTRWCRHHLVGPLARDLLARWESLVCLERGLQDLESWDGRPRGQGVRSQSEGEGHRPSHRESTSLEAKDGHQPRLWMALNSHQGLCNQDDPRLFSGDSTQEKAPSVGVQRVEEKERPGRILFRGSTVASRGAVKRPRHGASQRAQADHKDGGPGSFHPGQGPSDQRLEVRAKRSRVSTEGRPSLPQPPLPRGQSPSSAPPAFKFRSCLPIQAKELSSPRGEEEAGFPGQRIYAGMPVFSGSKRHSLLPKVTLNWQGLQDLDKDVGPTWDRQGGPGSVCEALLEKRTPHELCHLQKHNQAARGDREELWKANGLQDSKEEKPREQESLRETDLQLPDAQEQRLRALTRKIQSARAQKPQGRRLKMALVTSVGKPPQEVPGGQENVGTPGSALLSTGNPKNPSSSSDSNPPGSKHSQACPSSARPPLAPLLKSKKPTAKQTAPLMAKAMKDYRKIISGR